ncbi:hypothetical protein CKA55_01390 [Arcobacter suis]|uniref:Membrane protein n=1 Tax=Arcobacter suis CECT 7833 TaxID=663365 RepID=A0AAD0SV78_9BACT|nr:pentapeptide repeat-containing protein [Arcobacter suis]AXX88982.1 putative membrane protein [Arcobacter suis CECT 7833]RWS48009.1 hypothetical protein CKA55_01390 [Arcobacter suis]
MCKCSQRDCELEVSGNSDKCILHCEKDDWYRKSEYNNHKDWSMSKDKIEYFWTEFHKIIRNIQEPFFCNFNYIIFPAVEHCGYIKSDINKIKFLKLEYCDFLDEINLNFFLDAKSLEINRCEFYANVQFNVKIFEGQFIFQNNIVLKKINFDDIEFKDTCSFMKSEFKNELNFRNVRFNDYAVFNNTEIEDLLFRNTFFRKESNFLNMKLSKVGDRETARIIKDSFEKQNNIIEANKFYALEMKEREKELDSKKDFFEWLVFKFYGLSANHSQDWTLVLFWIININFFYSYLNIETNMWMLAFKILFSLILILLIGCMIVKIPEDNEKKRWVTTIPITMVCYFFYGYLVEKDWLLSEYSKNLNPFSIMHADEAINFGTLLFKIIIAYLIYQLIISIRQNTRRK